MCVCCFGENMSVFVTGIPSSGIALVARILKGLGFYFGAANDYIIPEDDNKQNSIYVRRDIIQLNNQLLNGFDASWECPRLLTGKYCLDTEESQLRSRVEKADQVLASLYRHGAWAIADPRLCLTSAFWLRRVPKARWLICVRDPSEVAAALADTHSLTQNFGMKLWPIYYEAILNGIITDTRFILDYNFLLNDPHGQIQRLAKWLGIDLDSILLDDIVGLVRNDVGHHRMRSDEVKSRLDRPRYAQLKRIYESLLEEAEETHTIPPDHHQVIDDDTFASSKIPRRILQYWDSETVPRELLPVMATWREQNLGWGYALYSDKAALEFIAKHYSDRELMAYRSCAIPAMKADFFRYLYIYKIGGYYADADAVCNIPLEKLESPGVELLVGKVRNGNWGNDFFGSMAGNQVLAEVIERVVNNIERRVSNNVWLVTGPGAFSPIVQNAIAAKRIVAHTLDVRSYRGIHGVIRGGGSLEYRQDGKHWSDFQKKVSIFSGESLVEEVGSRTKNRPQLTAPETRVTIPERSKLSSNGKAGGIGLHIHLGMPKTGTSVLQRSLLARCSVLGIQYPSAFMKSGYGHHELALSLKAEGMNSAMVAEFLDFLREHDTERTIISSESFVTMIDPTRYLDLAELWRKSTHIVNARMVLVIRRLDRFIESMYLQSSRFGNYSGDISEYVSSRGKWINQFFMGLGALKRECGDGLLIIPAIEKFDILNAFERIMGLQEGDLSADRGIHPSTAKLSAKAQSLLLELANIEKEIGQGIDRRMLIRAIERGDLCFINDPTRYTILSQEDSENIQESALDVAEKANISEYTQAFQVVEASREAYISLGRSLLDEKDMIALREIVRGFTAGKSGKPKGRGRGVSPDLTTSDGTG